MDVNKLTTVNECCDECSFLRWLIEEDPENKEVYEKRIEDLYHRIEVIQKGE